MHGLLRCSINAGVHARALLRDVTIARDGKRGLASANDVTHRKSTEDFGRFLKSQLAEMRLASGEDGWLSLACGGLGLVSHVLGRGCRWKSHHRKIVPLSPYVEEPLNSKVIKKKVSYLNTEVVTCFCYIILCVSCRIHTDTMNNRRRKTFFLLKYIALTLFVSVRKGYSRFACERELETEQKLQYFDPIVMAVNVVPFFFFFLYAQPLCWVLAFFAASYQDLPWTPIQSGLQKAPSAGCGFSYHTRLSFSNSTGTPTGHWHPSWQRYVIIQRPHDRLLDLWNRMFNRHQAEITVMQFTGHSPPVHQSMSLPWEFF